MLKMIFSMLRLLHTSKRLHRDLRLVEKFHLCVVKPQPSIIVSALFREGVIMASICGSCMDQDTPQVIGTVLLGDFCRKFVEILANVQGDGELNAILKLLLLHTQHIELETLHMHNERIAEFLQSELLHRVNLVEREHTRPLCLLFPDSSSIFEGIGLRTFLLHRSQW
jgi:hypothetical protein